MQFTSEAEGNIVGNGEIDRIFAFSHILKAINLSVVKFVLVSEE